MTDTPVVAPVRAITPMEEFRGTLTRLEHEFANALPPQIPPAKFVRTVLTAVQMAPDLLSADRRTLFASCMKAAQDGLLPDGREAALVIFSGKKGPMVQYLPMIGGLLKTARNSGEIASVSAHVAYEKDEFRYELGEEERIVHVPTMGDRGRPVAAYAIGRTKDGAVYRCVMSVLEIEQVRSCSRAKDGPWETWWAQMAEKTVLRRLLKRMPRSADLDALIEHDNETTDLSTAQSAPSPVGVLEGLKARMGVVVTPSEIAPPAAPQDATNNTESPVSPGKE